MAARRRSRSFCGSGPSASRQDLAHEHGSESGASRDHSDLRTAVQDRSIIQAIIDQKIPLTGWSIEYGGQGYEIGVIAKKKVDRASDCFLLTISSICV